jgi:hypothetical protein
MIPKTRLDEEIEKRRKSEADLATAKQLIQQFLVQQAQQQPQQQAQQQPKEPDIDDLLADLAVKEHNALLEGDVDTARTIRQQSNKLLVEQARREAYSAAQYTSSVSAEEAAFQHSLETATRTYPVFDANSPEYDETISNMALAIGRGLAAQGVPKSQIIYATLEQMKPVLATRQQAAAPSVPQPPQPQRSMQTNVQAAAAQPPATHRAGSAPQRSRIDVSTMTIEDFEKLSEKEIEQLYGG